MRLAATDGLYAPQSSLSLFMDSLHFLPAASSWRRTPVAVASDSNDSAVDKAPPVDRQIELVAMPSRRQEPESKFKATTTVRIHSRSRRSSSSSTSRSPRNKQSELRRAVRANAQLSSALMNKKLETSSEALRSTASQEVPMNIGYEINEQELANRFYTELQSNDSRETTSDASTPPLSPIQHREIRFMAMDEDDNEDTREKEWKARQLALEQQVAVLIAENQTKTALITYLMDENSRIVGDCECGKAIATALLEPFALAIADEETQHSSTCASHGRAQASEGFSSSRDAFDASAMEPMSPPSPTAAQVSPIQVPGAKRKLLETVSQHKQKQPLAAKETLLFEGLVSDIENEFSQLFTCERSTTVGEVGSTAA